MKIRKGQGEAVMMNNEITDQEADIFKFNGSAVIKMKSW